MTIGDRNPVWNADGTVQLPLAIKTSSFYTQFNKAKHWKTKVAKYKDDL